MANEMKSWLPEAPAAPLHGAAALRVLPAGAAAAQGGAAAAPAAKAPGLAGLSDAAAAQLLLQRELSADEQPLPDDRVLLVGLVWGGSTLIELERIDPGGSLPVGKLFDLPALRLPRGFRMVRPDGGELAFAVPAELPAQVFEGGRWSSAEELARQGRAQPIQAPFRGHSFRVGNGARVVVQVAPRLQLVSRYVRAGRVGDAGVLRSVDRGFAWALLVALVALGLFALGLRAAGHVRPQPMSDDLLRGRARVARFEPRPAPPREAKVPKDAAGAREGAKAEGDEGKLGKPEAKKKNAAPSRKGAPELDRHKAERDRRLVMRKGLLAALGKLGAGKRGAASDLLGPGGLGSGINQALGGVKAGARRGDALGAGGLGARGEAAFGGGRTLGIGGLGTRGGGRGRGGFGDVDLGGQGKDETRFVPGRTVVVGGLSREVIDRVIQRHYNEIRYCYEKELTRDPSLYGKVTVLFVIGGSGSVTDALAQQSTLASEPVESCIVSHVRRWSFPAPEGGGTVQVTYPYVFKSSGR